MGLGHDLIARILARTDDESRFECPSRNSKRIGITGTAADEVNHFEFVALSDGYVFPLRPGDNRLQPALCPAW